MSKFDDTFKRGDRLMLTSHYVFPLSMSKVGGQPAGKTIEIPSGAPAVVLEECGEHHCEVKVRFPEHAPEPYMEFAVLKLFVEPA